jgi:hypothetical protein
MRLAVLILALIAAAPVAALADVTVRLDNTKLHLPLPDGYCELDTDRAREASLFNFEALSLQASSRLLAMAADCGELEGFRLAHRPIAHTLTFVMPSHDGKPVRRSDDERAAYLGELADAIARTSTSEVTDYNDNWWKNFHLAVNAKSFGISGRDETALYIDSTRTLDAAKKLSVSSITAVTVAGNWPLSISFYQRGTDEHGLAVLRETAQQEVKALIETNQPPPPPVADDPSVTDSVVPVVPAEALDGQPATDPFSQLTGRFGQQGTLAVVAALSVMAFSFLLLLVTRPAAPAPYRNGNRGHRRIS